MTEKTDFNDWLTREFAKREFTDSTIENYSIRLNKLFSNYPDTKPVDISFEQIKEYISFIVKRKKYAPATIHQTVHACHCFYNSILKRNYDIHNLPRPSRTREVPELMTKAEVVDLIRLAPSEKYKLLFSIIYSAGLETIEAARLNVTDIDLRRKRIKIVSPRTGKKRQAILAERLCVLVPDYIKDNNLKKWLFPGRNIDGHINTSTIQKLFPKILARAGIIKELTPKSLRVAYIKHMESHGVPLGKILENLNIASTGGTRDFYDKIGFDDVEINFTPLDRLYGKSEKHGVDIASLQKRIAYIEKSEEREYLLEALSCFRVGALRAAVVLTWIAAIRNIQYSCLRHSHYSLNQSATKHYPKAKEIKRIEDFSTLKESIVLNVACDLGEIDKSEKDILVECLGLRNKCGHPGKYSPKPLKVSAFIEDLLTIVFSKNKNP